MLAFPIATVKQPIPTEIVEITANEFGKNNKTKKKQLVTKYMSF